MLKKVTPIKVFSFIILCWSFVDGFAMGLIPKNTYSFVEEYLVRLFLFFTGFFGIMSNGNSKRTRATLVALPFLYFSIHDIIEIIETRSMESSQTVVLFLILGLWILLFGDTYE